VKRQKLLIFCIYFTLMLLPWCIIRKSAFLRFSGVALRIMYSSADGNHPRKGCSVNNVLAHNINFLGRNRCRVLRRFTNPPFCHFNLICCIPVYRILIKIRREKKKIHFFFKYVCVHDHANGKCA